MAMNRILIGKEFYSVLRCGMIPYHKLNDDEYMLLLRVENSDGCKVYSDFGRGIKSNETYLNGLYSEVFTKIKPRIFTRQNWDDIANNDDSIKRVVRKIRCTRNVVHLEWLVPIELEYGNVCIQKSKTKLDWVKFSRDNKFSAQNLDGPLMNMMPQIAKKL